MTFNWKKVIDKQKYLFIVAALSGLTTFENAHGSEEPVNLSSGNTAAAYSDETAAFLAFDEMNALDIESAKLAIRRGHTIGVRNLGKMIVDDHEPIQEEARRIANNLGLKLSMQGRNPVYAKTIERLKSSSGASFDKAYMAYELPFSKNFIRKLKEEILPAVTHDELKIFLQTLIPKFEEHLMHIEHTAMHIKPMH